MVLGSPICWSAFIVTERRCMLSQLQLSFLWIISCFISKHNVTLLHCCKCIGKSVGVDFNFFSHFKVASSAIWWHLLQSLCAGVLQGFYCLLILTCEVCSAGVDFHIYSEFKIVAASALSSKHTGFMLQKWFLYRQKQTYNIITLKVT